MEGEFKGIRILEISNARGAKRVSRALMFSLYSRGAGWVSPRYQMVAGA